MPERSLPAESERDGASDSLTRSADPETRREERPVWRIDLFGATTEAEIAAEKSFYATLSEAWQGGDQARAFDMLSDELRARPSYYELHLLRAAVALDGLGAGTLPLRVLGGQFGAGAAISVEELLFVLAEFQRGIPERPPVAVPWTGLYHPYLFTGLIGTYVSLWSHGLRPFVRNQALVAGRVDVFEDFDSGSPSLIELVLTSQLLAAHGKVARARMALAAPVENHVAPEYVPRWRALLRGLEGLLDSLAAAPAREARSLLVVWEKAVTELIPEAKGTLLILPHAALEEVERRRSVGRARGGTVMIPDADAIRDSLAPAKMERQSGPPAGDSAAERAEHRELVDSFIAAALRLRDFRADALVRVRSGDATGVLSTGLMRDGDLVFVEEGRRRVGFYRERVRAVDPAPVDPAAVDGAEGSWSIPCGGGAWLRGE